MSGNTLGNRVSGRNLHKNGSEDGVSEIKDSNGQFMDTQYSDPYVNYLKSLPTKYANDTNYTLPKPQKMFEDFIDNSEGIPFIPKLP